MTATVEAGGARGRPGWHRVGKPLFDSLLLVFGVVLGFALNEWSQGRAQRTRAAQALAAIRVELEANRAAAAAAHVHHQLVHDSLTRYIQAGRVPPERIYYGQMFSPATLLGTAWTSARESRATDEMPYDLVLSLARVYDGQDRYRTLSDAVLGDVYGDMVHRGGVAVLRDGFANFDLLARDFADRERDLAHAYDSALVRVRAAHLR